jgi:peptidoglycan/LPS O-acetylase OafA/YrhL
LYLSGLVFVASGALFTPPAGWRRLALRRARRLLGPFFAIGLLVVAGKLLAARLVYVDNPPAGFCAGVWALLWHTAASPADSVWYLFVLFVLSLAAPVLAWADARLLVPAGLLLYLTPLPAYGYADHIGRSAVFFAAGIAAASAGARWTGWVDRHWRKLAAVFAAALAAIVLYGADWPAVYELLPVGLLSMPVLHGLVRSCGAYSAPVLNWLGRYSFMIYLFNTMFIGLAKALLLVAMPWDGGNFLPFAMALMLAGVFGPVALKRAAIRRSKRLDRFTN